MAPTFFVQGVFPPFAQLRGESGLNRERPDVKTQSAALLRRMVYLKITTLNSFPSCLTALKILEVVFSPG